MTFTYVLVTGATGFVGAHVVDNLLSRGIKVRAVARSKAKAEKMLAARKQYATLLEFYYIDDLSTPGVFDDAVKGGVDGVIHLASPLNYSIKDYEKECVIPAIRGVESVLEASVGSSVKRVVYTSSYGTIIDTDRTGDITYTSKDWNPVTYEEAINPATHPGQVYRASKTLAEKSAWKFIEEKKPAFDLVTLCPSMIFGPLADAPTSAKDINESNRPFLEAIQGKPQRFLPTSFWIDVRDLAEIHVQTLLGKHTGGKRYIPVAPEPFTYQMSAEIIAEAFPEVKEKVQSEEQKVNASIKVDNSDVLTDFPDIKYRSFKESVVDITKQVVVL